MATINKQNNLVMSETVNPRTGKSDAQVYRESSAVADRARAMLAGMNSGGGITSDSSSATRTERTIGRDIEDITRRSGITEAPDTSGLESLYRDQQREIERQRAALESRRAGEVAGIHQGFDVAKTATEQQQKRETGQTSMDLARAGGFLGVTASQKGVLQNLVITQREELNSLEAKRQEAIRAANNAYEDRDFELAREALKSAREIEAEIFNRKNVFFSQQMEILGEERAQLTEQRQSAQFLRDQANERLDRILAAGIVPSTDDIMEISQGLGISPDEASQIVKSAEASKALDDKERKTNRELAILNTLRGIPRDQSVVIDGVTYRGLAELSSSGSVSATQAAAMREAMQRYQFAQDLQGFWGGRDDNERLTIPIEEALTNYPDLDPKYIQDMYKALESVDNKKEMTQKLASGEWDIATINYGSTTGPVQIVYDKPAYEQAVRAWAAEGGGTGWFGRDKKPENPVTIRIDGEIYEGEGMPGEKAGTFVPPIFPDDYMIKRLD
jgi:hypothetical protein